MNSSLDLNLLLLVRQEGEDKTELPDLYAVTPPRRTAHGREADSLIIYLSMTGNSPLSSEAQSQLLERLAVKFYKTAGSLTAALRTIADALNMYLLDRNLRSTSVGRQGIGQLVLAALRADTLYVTQCGGVHAFVVTPKETQDMYDPQSSGRGMGLSRTTPMRFLHIKMNPDDFMVLATQAAPGWTGASLKHPQRQGIEVVRRQLLENGGQDFNAVIVQAQAGTGKLRLLKRKAEAPVMAQPATILPLHEAGLPVTSAPIETPPIRPAEDKRPGLPSVAAPATGTAELPPEDRRLGVPYTPPDSSPASVEGAPFPAVSAVEPAPHPGGPVSQLPVTIEVGTDQPTFPAEIPPETTSYGVKRQKTRPAWAKVSGSFGETLAKVGAAILRALRSAMATLAGALLRLLKSLLPDADVLRLPPSMMVFIALAIPLILATIGGMVYLQRGRAQQHEVYYQQAVEDAAYANSLTNPLEQRMAWLTVIGDLDKAEDYTLTSKSQELRRSAVESLDSLDAIKRLEFQPAIVGGLDAGVHVTRMVATATDLYMLNAAQGSVLRAIMTGRGYEVDPSFQCGPTFGPIDVGPLIDIAELPPGSFENASLLAMDANGNLLYCVVGSQPYSAIMAPPNTGFGEPTGMTLDRSDFYVLDPKVNAVWIYRNLEVTQQPRLFFGDEIPPMDDVIDLAVYNDDLFLLHADGHITKCTYSGLAESPTRCEEPYPYSDNRPGRIHGPVIEDTVFSQIYFLSFPERSIYLLDPQNRAIYYFSVLLNLQWQYQPKASIADGKATAFAISPNRTAFLAIGNGVYYAGMP
ncbi:MAG: hypothetical protein A2136_11000 [Chloroflexi bacterium RBG_16_54_11]|nr:MAG: hypothetical protein A2136_11000 [Chloroflexi bacterium RBG_16_54_11]